ncbi:MAG: NYN domain-containing protein [Verrucomicrobiaceae bacterium]
MPENERTQTMAVFCDFENIAIGTREAKYDKLDITKVLERLLVKGHIVVKKAYCDWSRYEVFKKPMHEASFELIEIPHVRQSGKNSADIRMVVDALDLCYTKPHMDTFVIISGDSDFSPLVSKLRENNKTVIGVGVKNSTSDLFISNCDEFIFYDDLVRHEKKRAAAVRKPAPQAAAKAAASSDAKPAGDPEKAVQLVMETADDIIEERGADEKLWGSMIKQALRRKQPGFNERYHGFRTFRALLEAARDRGLLELKLEEKSGDYAVKRIESD